MHTSSSTRPLFRSAMLACALICLFGCKSKPGEQQASRAGSTANPMAQVKDDTLKGFMLAGVYFVQGYGGSEKFYDKIKQTINQDNSKAPFLTLLDSAYTRNIVYPFPRSASEKVDSRNTLSDWFQINSQNDFYLFLNNLKDSGFQAHYALCRKALDDHGGASADISKIHLADYQLPQGSEILLKFVKDNYSKFSPAGIKAWNIGLYVYVVSLGYGAEYADAKTGKALIMDRLHEAEANYKDWQTYFSDFMLGREFSGVEKSENAVYQKAIDGMLAGHYSMYTYMPL